VVKIPVGFSFEKAALIGCGVITGIGAVINAAALRYGSTVAVIGCGGIGLNIVQGAKLLGARQIIAVDIHSNKLAHATTFGATHTLNARDIDPVQGIRDLTEGKGAEFTFEAIGTGATVAQAYDATKKGGKCVVVGIAKPDDRAPININQLVYAEKTLIGSLYGTTRPRLDLLTLIEMHQRGQLMLDQLISCTYPLDQINSAYSALLRGEVARSLIVF
jgi:S-(hydroxymethyl)glutathione dehydrogenase / alcohol dehydrogenase